MKQNTRDTTTDASTDDSHLDRPERNRYFHGKLMTARDMQAEQRYHRGQFMAHARHVTGAGVVCGLDVDVEGIDDGGLVITVYPGYALDSYGRAVVVPNKTTKELGPTEAPDDRITLYLDYSDCFKESVPIPGSENSCEEECAYNRVLEVFEIRHVDGGPEEGTVKSVPDIDFPTRKEVTDDDGEATQGPTNAELATIARSFTMDGDDAAACATGNPTVFLGVFDHAGGTTWEWVHDVPRSRVYTNDMLYAATARHTADFLNPHQVSLAAKTGTGGDAALHVEDDENPDANVAVTSTDETVAISATDDKQLDLTEGKSITDLKTDVTALGNRTDDHIANRKNPHQASLAAKPQGDGAALHVEDDENPDANVTVTSSDRTVAVSADADAKQVDLTAGEALLEIIEDRLAPMEQYVMDKTLKYKFRTFSGVADAFGSEAATRIAERTRSAILERTYADRGEYLSFLEDIHELERAVVEEVEGQATEETLERYGRAVERLGETLDGAGEAGVLRAAVAQDEVCEAAEWLEVANEDFRQSLQQKREAFSSVAERFDSEAAREVVDRTEGAITEGAHTEEAYREFVGNIAELEGEVASELEGTVTATSHERYVSGLRELFSALEGGDVRDAMAAQNGVSEAAGGLTPNGEETPDETLLASLKNAYTAFSGVVQRLDSQVAQNVVDAMEYAINNDVAANGDNYVGFVQEAISPQQNLTTDLEGTATPTSLERYGFALTKLASALEQGASPHDVAAAQNSVSQAATQLALAEETPDEALQSSLLSTRSAFSGVVERFDTQVAQEVVTMVTNAIDNGVATNGENYVAFVEELRPVEQDLSAELEGTASATTLERYDAAVGKLASALEQGASPRDVAAIQYGVSRAVAGLQHGSEEATSEDLQASLTIKRDAFSTVAERFDNATAKDIVTMTTKAIEAGVYATPNEYVAFIGDVAQRERELLQALKETATQASFGSYAAAVDELFTAISNEASALDVATAQNGVSRAAGALEPRGTTLSTQFGDDTLYTELSGDTLELAVDPSKYTVSNLQDELETVSDPMLLEESLATEMTTADRTTAKDAIRTRLGELNM